MYHVHLCKCSCILEPRQSSKEAMPSYTQLLALWLTLDSISDPWTWVTMKSVFWSKRMKGTTEVQLRIRLQIQAASVG